MSLTERSKSGPFDYAGMPTAMVPEAKAAAKRVRDLVRSQYNTIVETGRALLAIKEGLDHGLFGAWVEGACGMNIRSAQRYMSVALLPEDKHDTVSLLPPSEQYLVAQPTTPSELRDEVLAKVKAGEIKPGQVAPALKARIDEVRAAERSQGLTPEQKKKEDERRKREALEKERRRAEIRAIEVERDVLRPYQQAQAALAADMLAEALGDAGMKRLLWLLESSNSDARQLIGARLFGAWNVARPKNYNEPTKISLDLIFPTRLSSRPDELIVRDLEDRHQHRTEIIPILVVSARRSIRGVEKECFELVSGRNRLEAAKRLGWETIDAFVVDEK